MVFNMRIDVNTCNCTWGCMDTVRETALKVDWEKNPILHRGIKLVSAACCCNTLPSEKYPPPPPVLSTSQMIRCKARPTTLLAHKNLFWQLSRDRNLHGLGMSHATYSSLSKTTFQGTLENGCHYGWQRKCWIDSVKEWASLTITGLLTMASQRKGLEDLC